MEIVCLDLEGVLIPEIWVEFAKVTGIEELTATTRDIADYDVLMQQRIAILKQHRLNVDDIHAVIASLSPLEGAMEFLGWLREYFQVVILSDTFYEFAQPFMRQLGFPTLLCHRLIVDQQDMINGYQLRQEDPKRQAILALQSLNYRVLAAGDSYNDLTMLHQADAGILFNAPTYITDEYPHLPAIYGYDNLQRELIKASDREIIID
ncbi:MAG: phosphoserine/homoserine phosphotransferase [Candidatus Endobugula sp.]|jgi:phosphoserine/homoserine phosphotransferase